MQKVSQKGQLPVKQLKSMRKKLQVFMGIIELFLALLSYFIELPRTPPHSPALNRTIPPHSPALPRTRPRTPPRSPALLRTPPNSPDSLETQNIWVDFPAHGLCGLEFPTYSF